MSIRDFTELHIAAVSGEPCQQVVNLTPHAIRVLAYPFCWLGERATEEELTEAGWVRDKTNSGLQVDGGWLDIPPGDAALRLGETDELDEDGVCIGTDGFATMPESPTGVMVGCVIRKYAPPPELPEPRVGTTYIVSLPLLLGLAAAGIFRQDIVAPDSGPTCIRGADGQIVAVRGFVRVSPPAS